ncbi:MAG: purine permease [Pegethrix bostrychoides GSE-TBD4-15B]|uniref:Purine permease n=1 Tax=Pegethrix bostrychoides GSE-TBD4-15B TaxID=2839662 RepID=A0A951PDR5_9CYAN|nr:purine permease [Pegethrix bostrychoides GSE-TBD4-15B]
MQVGLPEPATNLQGQPAAEPTPSAPVESDLPDLIYGLDDQPPVLEALFVALQHVLAAFVGIITPPLIICAALGLNADETSRTVSMSLLASGICTFIQCQRIGPIGSGLLSLQGTSFAFLAPIVGVGTAAIGSGRSPQEALALIFGICFFGAFVEIFLSQFLHLAQQLISPVVSGTVVMIIGLSLIKTGMISLAGGEIARASGSYGSYQNLGLGGLVMLIVVALNLTNSRHLRMGAIAIGLGVGYAASIWLGLVDFSGLGDLPWIRLPRPFRYGMQFEFTAFIPFALLYLITAIETIGDLTATSAASKQPISGKLYMQRIKGGVLGDGFNSLLAAMFNSFPNTSFSQNNGVIQMTGVGSRYVGFYVAGILALLGLLPPVGGLLQTLPQPVLGGATIVMFGSIAVAGMNIIAANPIDRRTLMILSVSLALGLGVVYAPDILDDKPAMIRHLFSSGISTGGLTAMLLNLLLPSAQPK